MIVLPRASAPNHLRDKKKTKFEEPQGDRKNQIGGGGKRKTAKKNTGEREE